MYDENPNYTYIEKQFDQVLLCSISPTSITLQIKGYHLLSLQQDSPIKHDDVHVYKVLKCSF
jgi:hypothetical protein